MSIGKPFPQILKEWVLEPVGMTNSAYEQPLSPERDKQAARAHSGRGQAMDAKWHVYPELEAAGLWTTPTRSGEAGDRGADIAAGQVEPRALDRRR